MGEVIWGDSYERQAVALAILGLSDIAIAEQLAEDGVGPSHDTVRRWRRENAPQIEKAREHDYYSDILDMAQAFIKRIKAHPELLKPGQVALLVASAAGLVHKRAQIAVQQKQVDVLDDLWRLIAEGAARAQGIRAIRPERVVDLPPVDYYPGLLQARGDGSMEEPTPGDDGLGADPLGG